MMWRELNECKLWQKRAPPLENIYFSTYRRNESVVVTKVRFSLTPQARRNDLEVGWDIPAGIILSAVDDGLVLEVINFVWPKIT